MIALLFGAFGTADILHYVRKYPRSNCVLYVTVWNGLTLMEHPTIVNCKFFRRDTLSLFLTPVLKKTTEFRDTTLFLFSLRCFMSSTFISVGPNSVRQTQILLIWFLKRWTINLCPRRPFKWTKASTQLQQGNSL